jgi:hypothetical protein
VNGTCKVSKEREKALKSGLMGVYTKDNGFKIELMVKGD